LGIYNGFSWGTGSAFDSETGVNQPFGSTLDDVRYGESPRLAFSAYPFVATALTYSTASLSWTIPQGDYTSLRIVRSLEGYPETQEDGIIVYEWNESSGDNLAGATVDGEFPNPLIASGRFVYYRVWVLTTTGWLIAGDAITLIPSRHDSTLPNGDLLVSIENKFLDLLPRVFTSESQSPIDEVDPNSDLATFLDGFSFMLDSLLTYADLLLPDEGGRYVSPDIIFVQSLNLGLIPEAYIATKQQRRLIREALYIYQNKGTTGGVGTYVESFTGFAPDISPSPNLMLSPQDSSFTGGVGLWRAVGNATIEAVNTVPTVTEAVEPYATDYEYVGKATINQVGAKIVSGNDDPIRKGTPVSPGVPYKFSGYAQSDVSGGMPVFGYVSWYDQYGSLVRVDPPLTYTQDPQLLPQATWGSFEFTGRAPGTVLPLLNYSVTSGIATITFGTLNAFVPGETVIIDSDDEDINGQYVIQIPGINTITVETDLDDTDGTLPLIGTATEANPVLKGPLGTTDPTTDFFPIAGNITLSQSVGGLGTMSVDFSSAVFSSLNPLSNYLSAGDYFLIQGVSSTVDFGIHKVVSVSDTAAVMTYNDINSLYVASGAVLSGVTGFGLRVDTESAATPVTPAVYAGFETVFGATGTAYVDMIQLSALGVDEFHEARGVEVFLNASKTNYLPNPSFHPDVVRLLTGYSVSNGVATLAIAVNEATPNVFRPGEVIFVTSDDTDINGQYVIQAVGPESLFVFTTLDNTASPVEVTGNVLRPTWNITAVDFNAVPESEAGLVGSGFVLEVDTTALGLTSISSTTGQITSNKFLSASFYGRMPDDTIEANFENVKLTLSIFDAQVFLQTGDPEDLIPIASSTSPAAEAEFFTLTTEWQRFSTRVYVPAAEPLSVYIATMTIAGLTKGNVIYLDKAQLEDSFSPTDYFDGDLGSARGGLWEGSAHASASHFYPNLAQKTTRLTQELKKYLATNQPYVIQWHGGGLRKSNLY
jgi:hypothetical protein